MTRTLTIVLLCVAGFSSDARGADPLVELVTKESVYRGRNVVHSSSYCWLETPLGRYEKIDLNKVVSFRKLDGPYRASTHFEQSSALRKELGRDFEIRADGHCLIAGPAGRVALYGALLNEVYRSNWNYFSRRGFRLREPEHPLVVIILPSHAKFLEFVTARGSQNVSQHLRGQYERQSNQMVFYDEADTAGNISSFVRATVIHESVHQFTFNTGLTQRLADLPTWLVEGLAINLEEEANREGKGTRIERASSSRLAACTRFRRMEPNWSLPEFLADDGPLFKQQTLDAYAVSWALTFYLMETRTAEFSRYLQHLQQRDLQQKYPPQDRLADFQKVLGQDLRTFEIQWARFMDELAAN